MASVNLRKHGTQEACSGIIRHNYRESAGHSNKDIQPELSYLNKTYSCSTGYEARERLKQRIRELDEEHPPQRIRADRKTCLSIVIPSPREGMSAEDEAAWADASWGVLKDMFGDDLIDGVYHADEVHTYLDGGEVHKSRGHLHADVIPHTDGYGVNMKHFFTRDLPIKINSALDEKCMEMFGYRFQDGSKKKSRGSVEQLKAEEVIQKREEVRQAEAAISNALFAVEEAERKAETAEKAAAKADQKAEDAEARAAVAEAKAQDAEARAAAADTERDEAIKERNATRQEVRTLGARIEAMKAEFAEWAAKLQKGVVAVFDKLNNVRRIANNSPWLSDRDRGRVFGKAEEITQRTRKAVAKPLETVEDYMAAYGEVEAEKMKSNSLERMAKGKMKIEDLEDEWER